MGLNFAKEEEAENFFFIVDQKISQRQKHLGQLSKLGHESEKVLVYHCLKSAYHCLK